MLYILMNYKSTLKVYSFTHISYHEGIRVLEI
jgi:hypothetical protein